MQRMLVKRLLPVCQHRGSATGAEQPCRAANPSKAASAPDHTGSNERGTAVWKAAPRSPSTFCILDVDGLSARLGQLVGDRGRQLHAHIAFSCRAGPFAPIHYRHHDDSIGVYTGTIPRANASDHVSPPAGRSVIPKSAGNRNEITACSPDGLSIVSIAFGWKIRRLIKTCSPNVSMNREA